VFTYSEPIDPQSVLAGWNGSATNVRVLITDNGLLGLSTGDDNLQVYNAAGTAALPLGAVDLGRGDYVAGLLLGSISFGATGPASTMTMSGNTITVPFGTCSGTLAGRTTAAAAGTMIWSPVPPEPIVLYDRAGNILGSAGAVESGAADKDF